MPRAIEKWLQEGSSPARIIYGLASGVTLVVTLAGYADHAHHPGAVWWLLAGALVIALWALSEMVRWRIRHNRLQRELSRLGPGTSPHDPAQVVPAAPTVDPTLWNATVAESGDHRTMTFQLDHRFSERLAVQTFTLLRVTVTDPGQITTSAEGLGRIYQYPAQFPSAPAVRPGIYHSKWEGRDDHGGWHDITEGTHEVTLSGPEPPPLVLTVEDEDWFLFRQAGYVCGLLLKITNTTNRPVTVVSYGIGMDWPSQSGGVPEAFSGEDDRILSEQARVRREGGRYDPLLTTQPSTLPPHGEVSGWLVTHAFRPASGGAPRCTIQLTDQFRNKYTKVIEHRPAQHYKS
jgi:hypothetical protein